MNTTKYFNLHEGRGLIRTRETGTEYFTEILLPSGDWAERAELVHQIWGGAEATELIDATEALRLARQITGQAGFQLSESA